MFKEKKLLLVIVLMTVLLVTNLLTWSNTKLLDQKTTQLQEELYNISSRVSSEVTGVRNVVQDIQNDARWWTPADIEILEFNKEQAQVKLSWQLKEYKGSSKVAFHYLPPGEKEYLEVAAKEESGGNFFVILPIKVPLNPYVDIMVSGTEAAIREEHAVENEAFMLTHYISVQDGETIRTTERRTLGLSKLSLNFFNPLHVMIELRDGKEIYASINEHKIENPTYKIKDIYLENRDDNNKVLQKWPFELENMPAEEQNIQFYQLQTNLKENTANYNSLILVIEYSQGLIVEKEIL